MDLADTGSLLGNSYGKYFIAYSRAETVHGFKKLVLFLSKTLYFSFISTDISSNFWKIKYFLINYYDSYASYNQGAPAVAQSVRAFTPQVEGWEFE